MKRKESKPVTKHTLNLFEGQVEKLQALYPRLGAAYAIRRIIDLHIEEIEAKAATAVPAPEPTVTVEEILP